MELKGMHIVVFGLGRTGEALVRFLLDRGARVSVTDSRPAHLVGKPAERIASLPVSMQLGGHDEKIVESADWIVLSPGVPHTLSVLERAARAGIPVIGEIELASRFVDEPIVAITGTNGKSTVTRLVGRMLEYSGLSIFLGGNLGRPLIDYVAEAKPADAVVIEVSSFQLDTIVHFRPSVGVLLNISPDHLDRYPDFGAYAASKARVFENQLASDTAVVNAADETVMRMSVNAKSRLCTFNDADFKPCSALVSDTEIRISFPDTDSLVIPANRVPLAGRHNLENTAAAALAALAAGASREGIMASLGGFVPDPHRLEQVAIIKDVAYYDDSKATNVDAAVRAIESMRGPVILIAGGRDKFGGYEALRKPVERRVKAVIVLGEAADAILETLCDVAEVRHADTMAEAVEEASRIAAPGDAVLLSPACSSFDMYENYEARGDDFARAVRSLDKMVV